MSPSFRFNGAALWQRGKPAVPAGQRAEDRGFNGAALWQRGKRFARQAEHGIALAASMGPRFGSAESEAGGVAGERRGDASMGPRFGSAESKPVPLLTAAVHLELQWGRALAARK